MQPSGRKILGVSVVAMTDAAVGAASAVVVALVSAPVLESTSIMPVSPAEVPLSTFRDALVCVVASIMAGCGAKVASPAAAVAT